MAVGLLIAAAWYTLGNRVDPARVPQSTWYTLATSASTGSLAPLPAEHDVVVQPLAESPIEVLVRYLPKPLGRGNGPELQGEFDPGTGKIMITGPLARLQATLPFRWMQPLFIRTLRHEYGHAFLADWLEAHKIRASKDPYLPYTPSGKKADLGTVPADLRPLVTEYRAQPKKLYDQTYLMSSFDEYFAESYQRYVAGDTVPPKMRAFLDAAKSR